MDKKISKRAQCIRNVSSWSHVAPSYKFDSITFDKSLVSSSIKNLSPKMDMLLEKIKELDEKDLQESGNLYKHIIYSDVSGTYGAKMVASVLIANGKTPAYNKIGSGNTLKIKSEDELKKTVNNNFALLTSSVVFGKPLTVKTKKTLLSMLNKRPDNIYGENIRFLILDQTFKEGIDVFDVKYLHILEPLMTKAEQTQVIGRGTRFCGQMGLPFNPKYGWNLEIYKYNMMYDDRTDVFQLFLNHANIDLSTLNFTAELEDLLKASAVDLVLTENIHEYGRKTTNRFKQILNRIESVKPPLVKKDKNCITVNGILYCNTQKLNCIQKCKGPLEDRSLFGILIIAAIQTSPSLYKDLKLRIIELKPKLCQQMEKSKDFCAAVNSLWMSPINYLKIYAKDKNNTMGILSQLKQLKKRNIINETNYQYAIEYIKKYYDIEEINKEKLNEALPPAIQLKYLDMKKYIKKYYKRFTWPEIKIENLCDKQKSDIKDKETNLVSFTLSQDFVRHYFIPQSPYKGLLLYHSVGTGKTCSAIATASTSFQRQGYTIIWVTRHTLKEDIFKNMFDKICNTVIQEQVKNGIDIPTKRADRLKLLGDKWFPVLSYKQFTNMIQGKNEFYKKLVKINGVEDPLKNTLIIIDEIHKIYSSSLSRLEKPNPLKLHHIIQKSYDISGPKSVRMLLMTATPITEDPLSAIKILNLLLPREQQFPDKYEEFINQYCTKEGIFTDDGFKTFLNKVSGYISYLDRSSDTRQFAYPVMKTIMVNPKRSSKDEVESKISEIQNRINDLQENVPDKPPAKNKEENANYKAKMQEIKDKVKYYKQELKGLKNLSKDDKSVLTMIEKCITSKNPNAILVGKADNNSFEKSESPKVNKKRLVLKPK